MPFSVKKYKSRKKYNAYKRCVKKVGEKDESVNPYAVCSASVLKKGNFKDFRKGTDEEYYKSLRNLGMNDYEARRSVAKRKLAQGRY